MSEAILGSSGHGVGVVLVDANRLRAEGGSIDPALIVPITFELAPERSGPIALSDVEAQLACPGPVPTPLGPPVRMSPRRTLHGGRDAVAKMHTEFRFRMPPELLNRLEWLAASAAPSPLTLGIMFQATVSWVRGSGNSFGGTSGVVRVDVPFDPSAGLLHDLVPFDEPAAATLVFQISRERWAEQLLPALGLDRVRLLSVFLPRAGGVLSNDVVRHFDEARLALDAGRFRDAVGACRDVLETIERDLGAKSGHLETALAAQLAVPVTSPLVALVQGSWKSLTQITNRASHPADSAWFARVEARTTLMLTAVLLEALSEALAAGV